MNYTFEQYRHSADFLRARLGGFSPKIAMILGSGLGYLGDLVEDAAAVPYGDIPHFKTSTAPGHKGRLVFGTLEGQPVAVMQGRMHHYEGYSYEEVGYAVRVLRLLGCDTLIVTNGDQTDTLRDGLRSGKTFGQSLKSRRFEPDGPNWTPRISAILTFAGGDFDYHMSILKSADAAGSACNRFTFAYESLAGLGHFIHTYVTDGSPIPTFQGEPERLAIGSDPEAFTRMIWENLNDANKISLYTNWIDLATGREQVRIINKHQ